MIVLDKTRVPYRWGFSPSSLGKLSNAGIRNLYYGTRNLEVPGLMLDVTNADEAAALFWGACDLKRHNLHQDMSREFFQLVGDINRHSYPSYSSDILALRESARLPNKRGEMRARLMQLPLEVREEFMDSWFSDYLYPHGLSGEACFADVGEGCKKPSTRNAAYIRELARYFERRFDKNHPRVLTFR